MRRYQMSLSCVEMDYSISCMEFNIHYFDRNAGEQRTNDACSECIRRTPLRCIDCTFNRWSIVYPETNTVLDTVYQSYAVNTVRAATKFHKHSIQCVENMLRSSFHVIRYVSCCWHVWWLNALLVEDEPNDRNVLYSASSCSTPLKQFQHFLEKGGGGYRIRGPRRHFVRPANLNFRKLTTISFHLFFLSPATKPLTKCGRWIHVTQIFVGWIKWLEQLSTCELNKYAWLHDQVAF